MQAHDYYSISRHPRTGERILSNSLVKELYALAMGAPQRNEARKQGYFDFGRALHIALLEEEKFENKMVLDKNKRLMLIAMVNKVYSDVGVDFFRIARHEREYYRRLFGYMFKSKVDWVYQPGPTIEMTPVSFQLSGKPSVYYCERNVIDVKSTGADRQEKFESDAKTFDYDMQGFIYLNLTESGLFTLMGVQKTQKTPNIYWLTMDRESEMYASGEKKLLMYLDKVKHLIAA